MADIEVFEKWETFFLNCCIAQENQFPGTKINEF